MAHVQRHIGGASGEHTQNGLHEAAVARIHDRYTVTRLDTCISQLGGNCGGASCKRSVSDGAAVSVSDSSAAGVFRGSADKGFANGQRNACRGRRVHRPLRIRGHALLSHD